MAIEGFSCQIKVKPVAEWIQQEKTEKQCPTCLIKPLTEYYLGALEEAKATNQLAALKKAWESADSLTIAQTMDKIKSEVGDALKKELVSLDCMAQSYEDN